MVRSFLVMLAVIGMFLLLLMLTPLAERVGITLYLLKTSHYRKGWESQPYTYDVSSSGDTVVFTGGGAGGRDLYLLDTSARQVRRLTKSEGFEHEVCFLGDYLVVTSVAEKPNHPLTSKNLYLVDVRNGAVHRLTDDYRTYHSDLFPISSYELLFTRMRIDYSMKPWGLEVEGSDPRWYILDIRSGATEQVQTQNFDLNDAFLNGIFRDRRRIIQTSIIEDRYDLFLRYLSVPVGTLPTRSNRTVRLTRNGRDAVIAPDERSIYYVSDHSAEGQSSIMQLDLTSRRVTPVLLRDGFITSLRVRGQWIFFLQSSGTDISLWRLNLRSKTVEQLLSPARFANPLGG
jgi:Tol biopolymer transport system component